MPKLLTQLDIDRCPHCQVDNPSIFAVYNFDTITRSGRHKRFWRVYRCVRCGGAILAGSTEDGGEVREMYPVATGVDENIPEPARDYLKQALNSIHSPAGSVMLCASSVDAMLKSHGYTDGSLYSRIDKAKEDHLITEGMAQWAHEVRLDANDPRHADKNAPLPSEEDARKCVDFTKALGQFLFVSPARVQRGLTEAAGEEQEQVEETP